MQQSCMQEIVNKAWLQPSYNLLHATLLHSGWWPLDSVNFEILYT